MKRTSLLLLSIAIASAFAVAACSKSRDHNPAADQHGGTAHSVPPSKVAPAPEKPHGGHDPTHGGLVLMDGHDHHAELVLDTKAGHHRVYVSDGARGSLPASTFDEVSMTITPPSGDAAELLSLSKATDDSHWMAAGKPVPESGAKIKLSYARAGAKLYEVELPVEYILTGKMPDASPATPASGHAPAAPHGGQIGTTSRGHIELVADATGTFRVWLLDATMQPRASSDATIRVTLSKAGYAEVTLSPAADHFEGKGASIAGHANATVTATIAGKTESAAFPLHLEQGGGHGH